MSDPDNSDDDLSLLAAEYVLGVLSPAQRRIAVARAIAEPALDEAILYWEALLTPLARAVPEVAPPPELWERINRALGPAPSRAPARAWQAATATALALAAGLAAFAVLSRPAKPVAVASLGAATAPAPSFLVQVLPGGHLLVTRANAVAVPTAKDLELWALPHGANRPVPLGVLPAGGKHVEVGPLASPGGQLLISLEPKGGSPTGLPTGPVLYGGVILKL